MKKIKMIMPAVLLTLSLTACNKQLFGTIKGKGNNVTEIRSVSGFDRIDLDIDANVIYVQDSVFSLKLTGQSNVLAVLTTDVSNGELEIDYEKGVRNHNTVTLEIHSPSIRGLSISGSGNITSTGTLTANFLKLKISGSGNIELAGGIIQNLEASISGSGNIDIDGGTSGTQVFTISGSGNMNTGYLQSQHSDTKISGSGTITVHAAQSLNATISGSGDIRYYGNPTVNVNVSGSGSVIHL